MLRDYQKKIIDKLRALKKGARVCVVAPTGSGKSHLISYLAEAFYKQNKKVLIIAHRKTLLEQNREKFKGKASFYCAGLNKKCLKNDVVFGSIQSLANVDLPKFDCVLIDECHRVSFNENTQYQKLLNKQKEAYIFGFTATPFRLRKGGNVSIVGKGRYFDTLIESDSIASLTKDGYLCPLKTRVDITTSHADFKKDFKLDFDLKEASELLQRKATSYIESIKQAFIKQPPKRAIIFCCDVEHVIDTYNKLNAFIPCTAVASRLTDNKKALADFTSGKAKVLINCEILTEGYDLPSIDYVVLLRPTDSASLFVQMVGRGLRTAPSKEHCTVLDFGGNIEKHGPLNDVALDHWSGKTVPPDKVRICPKCFTATEDNPCPECSHSFGFSGFERKKPEDKLKKLHSTMDLLKQQTSTYKIKEIKFFEHFKGGIPSNLLTDRTLRIEFINEHGICMHKEWLALNHAGFAREKATQTWQKFNSAPAPKSVRDALNLTDTIKKIDSITVFTKHNPKDKYPKRTIRAIKYAN